MFKTYCAFPENIHTCTHPKEGYGKIPKRRGVSKAQFFNQKYDAKLKFSVGLGVQIKKTFQGGGYGYFLELHISKLVLQRKLLLSLVT